MENNKTSTGLKVALGIAVALFLVTGFYTFDILNDKKEMEEQLTQEKELVMNDLSNMAKQYETAIGENEIANEKLVEARDRIQGLIDSLKISETNVKSLYRYKQKYQSLQKEMDVLLAENDKLKVENELLATSLDSTKVQLEERAMFTDSLLVQNTALSEVVENASVLHATNLKVFGVIERSSGKMVPTERARRSDKLKVCFTVAKNKLVQSGDQELYIQIIDPKNNTLGENNQVQYGDEILTYSLISKFNYENKDLDICEYVKPNGGEFSSGRYVVNVFNEKDLISTSEFTLK